MKGLEEYEAGHERVMVNHLGKFDLPFAPDGTVLKVLDCRCNQDGSWMLRVRLEVKE